MKWTERILKLQPKAEFCPSASEVAIADAERNLGVAFPGGLKSLLLESDGVHDIYGSSFIWSSQEIAERNTEFRGSEDFAELYMPFDHLLFFGDAGNGDQFALPILAGEIRSENVFAWNHEDDSRSWVAPDLGTFIDWWLSGKIKL